MRGNGSPARGRSQTGNRTHPSGLPRMWLCRDSPDQAATSGRTGTHFATVTTACWGNGFPPYSHTPTGTLKQQGFDQRNSQAVVLENEQAMKESTMGRELDITPDPRLGAKLVRSVRLRHRKLLGIYEVPVRDDGHGQFSFTTPEGMYLMPMESITQVISPGAAFLQIYHWSAPWWHPVLRVRNSLRRASLDSMEAT